MALGDLWKKEGDRFGCSGGGCGEREPERVTCTTTVSLSLFLSLLVLKRAKEREVNSLPFTEDVSCRLLQKKISSQNTNTSLKSSSAAACRQSVNIFGRRRRRRRRIQPSSTASGDLSPATPLSGTTSLPIWKERL